MNHDFQYQCENGHWIVSHIRLTTCPATPHGKPCNGLLKRVGSGSRTAAK